MYVAQCRHDVTVAAPALLVVGVLRHLMRAQRAAVAERRLTDVALERPLPSVNALLVRGETKALRKALATQLALEPFLAAIG